MVTRLVQSSYIDVASAVFVVEEMPREYNSCLIGELSKHLLAHTYGKL
jgi:hypothetical protein